MKGEWGMASYPIYQFYSELCNYEPKIWRRFQVPGNITMAQLGYIIMTMYEMQASHLFDFSVPSRDNFILYLKALNPNQEETNLTTFKNKEIIQYKFQNDDIDILWEPITNKMKSAFFSCSGEKLTMKYDNGDGWEIGLTLENIIMDKELPGRELPRVLGGAGYGIIEDCGGPGGLKQLADVFQKKTGLEYEDCCKWLGRQELDLLSFDSNDMNFRLKKIPRIYRDIYEYGVQPTQRSINLLERKYLKR